MDSDPLKTPNPFAAPSAAAETRERTPVDPALLEVATMPWSVRFAIAAISLSFALSIIDAIIQIPTGETSVAAAGVKLGIQALILTGLIFQNRLAWQWGYLLSAISAILVSLLAAFLLFAIFTKGRTEAEVIISTAIVICYAVLLGTVHLALGKRTALQYFRLVCPKCGRTTRRAADFFFRRAKCSKCKNVW